MTSGAPWSVKGIDPKAREVAKDLARRSGMTLGEWLNQVILQDDGPEDATSESFFADHPPRPAAERVQALAAEGPAPRRIEAPAHPADYVERMAGLLERLTSRIEDAETRAGEAVSGVEQSVRSALARIEAAEQAQSGAASDIGDVKASAATLAERLRRMEENAGGPRSSEALRALEGAISKIAGQVYEGQSRTREILDGVEARISQIEDGGDVGGRLVDEVVNRVSARLAEAESRTSEALEGLRESLAALDGRIRSVEDGSGLDGRLEGLTEKLAGSLEATRAEFAAKLASGVEGRFDRIEAALAEMSGHVRSAEERSASAIAQMGKEVLNVAEVMNRRVQAAEARSAQVVDQVSGEMGKIAQAMESRLSRSESIHAEALERLSGEISRITERLAERIANAERRSAQAIDDVGEQVARVTERINQRAERSSEELADRIRQSEERTARLLDEARDRIAQRLSELGGAGAAPTPGASPFSGVAVAAGALAAAPVATAPFEASSFPAREPAAQAEPPAAFSDDPFAGFPDVEDSVATAPETAADFMSRAFPSAADAAPAVFAAEPAPVFEPEPETLEPESAAFEADVFARNDAPAESEAAFAEAADPEAASADEAFADDFAAAFEAADEPAFAAEPAPSLFAAPEPEADDDTPFMTAFEDEPQERGLSADDAFGDLDADIFEPERPTEAQAPVQPGRPLSTREVVEQARAAARAAAASGDLKGKKGKGKSGTSLFSSFSLTKSKRRAGGSLQTFLLVSGGAAFLGLAAGGVALMAGKPGGEPPERVARSQALAQQDAQPVGEGEGMADPRAAIALAPQNLSDAAPADLPASSEAQAADLSALFAESVRALEGGEPNALDELKKAANLGHAPAQLYLGKLYEDGKYGVKRDLAEARRWTERAAQGGDRRAMHNVALFYFNGEGGTKNTTTSAQWFRRAAELGLVDSQYNLGRLYEEGLGVSQNAAEAYKWYLIAARTGDSEARVSAQRVKASLSPEARLVAERAAAGFRPATPGVAQTAKAASSTVVAQRALSKLGYYQGPEDGEASPALRLAVAAYQRDQSLPASGALDDATVARLQAFVR